MPDAQPTHDQAEELVRLGALGANELKQGTSTAEVLSNHAEKIREYRERVNALEHRVAVLEAFNHVRRIE